MSKEKIVTTEVWQIFLAESHYFTGVSRVMLSPISCIFIALAVLAMSAASASAQGRFVLEKVFYGQSGNDNTPVSWAYNDGGYVGSFTSVYRSGCVGSYKVMFSFDRDIRVIADGGQFQVTIRKLTGHTPCGFKQSGASMSGSNNISTKISPEFPSNYEYNGNISGSRNGIGMWGEVGDQSVALVTMKAKKPVPYTAFTLVLDGPKDTNYLVFLYRYENAAAPTSLGKFENGINRPGRDYRSFFQSVADPAICEAACWDESQCRAWTWVRPGLQGAQSKCWLKKSIPSARKDDCCTSGTKLVKQ